MDRGLWFPRAPEFPIPLMPDSANYNTIPQQEIGFGIHLSGGYHLTRNKRLRSLVSLGFRRQAGRAYFHGWVADSGGAQSLTAGRMFFSLHSIRLGLELQYQPLRWDLETEFPDDPGGVVPAASVERWYAVVLRLGATGIWHVGSNIDASGRPHPDSIGRNPLRSRLGSGSFNTEYFDGPIPGLDPYGLELLLGLSLEFPVGDQVIGSIGVSFSHNLRDLTPDRWSHQSVAVQGGIGW